MICYASRTGTRRNLAALRRAGWRLLVSARGVLRNEGFPYALDNGAWTAFQNNESFDELAFDRAVSKLGEAADFVVIPDIVAAGRESLLFSLDWLPRLRQLPRLLLAVQDGMTIDEIRPILARHRIGVFLGGSTEWKLETMPAWGRLCAELGLPYHVARVNSAKRLHLAEAAGAHSIDGSSASRYAVMLPNLAAASKQRDFFSVRAGVAR